jgi:NAD(P)-dependent dehydrogenase (short-subunit alcohol dehydrogenase family)
MSANLADRRLLVAGDPRTAAIAADGVAACANAVAFAADTGGATAASIPGHAIPYDGRSEADVDRAVDLAVERLQRLDGLIVVIVTAPMPPLDQEGPFWEPCVNQPLRAAFWLVRRTVHEWLVSGGGGPIVLIVEAGDGEGGARTLSIVESALVSFARSVAKEYGRRAITCNVVSGGATPAARRAAVDLALFLASPGARFVTGECLRVAEHIS